MKRRILIYGHDKSLLDVRAALLRSAGFDVLSAYTGSKVEQLLGGDSIDVFILCHTVSAEEDEDFLLKVGILQPQMKALVLTRNWHNEFASSDVATFDIGKGPKSFIETLKALVTAT